MIRIVNVSTRYGYHRRTKKHKYYKPLTWQQKLGNWVRRFFDEALIEPEAYELLGAFEPTAHDHIIDFDTISPVLGRRLGAVVSKGFHFIGVTPIYLTPEGYHYCIVERVKFSDWIYLPPTSIQSS